MKLISKLKQELEEENQQLKTTIATCNKTLQKVISSLNNVDAPLKEIQLSRK